jgi:hypothetical protein
MHAACVFRSLLALAAASTLAGPARAAAPDDDPRRVFADPPRQYHTLPFWVWNDDLTDEQVRFWMQDFADHGIRSVIVHPRPGLMTPYLSDRWFALWKLALAEAERLDMDVWIYDENSYPSGFAGGFVPEAMPDAKAVNLVARESKTPPAMAEDIEAVFRIEGDAAEDVTAKLKAGGAPGPGRYLAVARKTDGRAAEWYGGWWYVDLLKPGVTEKFLELTLEPYRARFGDLFGKRIPGSFTDEPHLSGVGGLPWTGDFAERFEQRWGYALRPQLASLFQPVGDWRRVRHDYYKLAHELFVERWAKPYFEYCAKNRLEFTGHYWEHSWPQCRQVPDNMAMYAWHQRPAIDILFNQYAEGTHAQFGNVRSLRELASAAAQRGFPRTLCEGYGGSGWDVRFEDLKRIGDWLLVLGVNTINQHLSHTTVRGARKRDYPVSFSYHAPWWDAYGDQARYFARLQAALSQGEPAPAAALVIEPTTTAWLHQEGTKEGPRAVEMADAFMKLLVGLEAAQTEYELGSEDMMARWGSVENGRVRVGRRAYPAVVLAPFTETLDEPVMTLLEGFAAAGGRIFSCGPAPALVDGRPSDRGAALARAAGWRGVAPEDLAAALAEVHSPGARVMREAGDAGTLFHMRRRVAGGELLFLVNTSSNQPARGRVAAPAKGAEDWCAMTGKTGPAFFRSGPDGLAIPFDLPPCGSRLLFLSDTAVAPAHKRMAAKPVAVAATGPMEVRRVGPAALTLDFVDVTCAGEAKTNVHVVAAADFVFSKNGFEKNPWRHAVQFRDRIVSTKFAVDSGFDVVYRFTVEGAPPRDLEAVVEQPALYEIACNGTPVKATPGTWWFDRAFGRIPIADAAREGENTLTLRARPMTIRSEIDLVHLLGSFSLKPAARGFVVAPERPLAAGPWTAQGQPFHSDRVVYAQTFPVPSADVPHRVRLPSWWGALAEVSVNGKPAGRIAYPPYELDVDLAPGANRIEVAVVGTRKNLVGPHHAGPVRGLASPHNMAQAPKTGQPPGEAYDLIGCGLFEPFVLERMD